MHTHIFNINKKASLYDIMKTNIIKSEQKDV